MVSVSNSLPEAFTGSGLYFKQTCQGAETGGSLERMMIKAEITQANAPPGPVLMSGQVGFCFSGEREASCLPTNPVSLLTASSNKNHHQGLVTSKAVAIIIRMMSGTQSQLPSRKRRGAEKS